MVVTAPNGFYQINAAYSLKADIDDGHIGLAFIDGGDSRIPHPTTRSDNHGC